jgi:hypothetical protein
MRKIRGGGNYASKYSNYCRFFVSRPVSGGVQVHCYHSLHPSPNFSLLTLSHLSFAPDTTYSSTLKIETESSSELFLRMY